MEKRGEKREWCLLMQASFWTSVSNKGEWHKRDNREGEREKRRNSARHMMDRLMFQK